MSRSGCRSSPKAALASKISASDKVVRFEFDVFKSTVDGFDWKAGPGCVTIEMRFDGKSQPAKVRLGAKGEAASLFPMDACP